MSGSRHRFLVPDWLQQGTRVALPESEVHHARVARIRDHEEVEIFDGRGHSSVACFAVDGIARLTERLPDRHRESATQLTLAVAPLKKDRFDWLIEKVTEIGVAGIVVFAAERVVARPSQRRRHRWQQIAAAAAKQCGRSIVPTVTEATGLAHALAGDTRDRFVLHESGEHAPLAAALAEHAADVIIAIGPEGGFTDSEIEQATRSGATIAALGTRVLRAETAAVAGAALALCADFSPPTDRA